MWTQGVEITGFYLYLGMMSLLEAAAPLQMCKPVRVVVKSWLKFVFSHDSHAVPACRTLNWSVIMQNSEC
jgi:hypothetical protein